LSGNQGDGLFVWRLRQNRRWHKATAVVVGREWLKKKLNRDNAAVLGIPIEYLTCKSGWRSTKVLQVA